MKWISVKDALPEDGQACLVRYNRGNWFTDNKLSDGRLRKSWCWQAAKFIRGRTKEEITDGIYRSQDQDGNNLVPYCWDEFGSGTLFGQDVSHWAAIDPTEDD